MGKKGGRENREKQIGSLSSAAWDGAGEGKRAREINKYQKYL